MLNRVVGRDQTGYTIEADPRHAEIAIRDLGLEGARGSKLLGSKGEAKKAGGGPAGAGEYPMLTLGTGKGMSFAAACPGRCPPTPLMREGNPKHAELKTAGTEIDDTSFEGAEAKLFRGILARLNYLGPDRPDIQYAVQGAARAMASPRACDWCLLKKIGRYLVYRPRLQIRLGWQKKHSCMDGCTDSDRAGCQKPRKSTSGSVLMIGHHCIKSSSKQQKVIALSSAEAELYAMVAASAEAIAMSAYARDLGMDLAIEMYCDSAAALGITDRAGIGKVRHLRTQGLWVQEARVSGIIT